ncbi:MAG TPA: PAS domain S-box protein [Cytophagaceae bacterium]
MIIKDQSVNTIKEFFAHFFHSTSDLFCEFSKDGNYLSVNPSFQEEFGYDNYSLFNQPAASTVAKEDAKRFKQSLETVITEFHTYIPDLSVIHRSGFTIVSDWYLLYNETTNTIYAYSPKKVLESSKLNILGTIGHEALLKADLKEVLDKVVNYISETLKAEFCHILKYDYSKEVFSIIAGKGLKDEIYNSDTFTISKSSISFQTMKNNKVLVVDDLLTHTQYVCSKTLIDAGVRSGIFVPIPGDKQPYGVFSIKSKKPGNFSYDLSQFLITVTNFLGTIIEKKNNDERINLSEQSYRDLFNYSSDLIIITDKEGKILDVNQSVLNAYGYNKDEILNQPIEFISDKEKQHFDFNTSCFAKGSSGQTIRCDWYTRGKNGNQVIVEYIIRRQNYFSDEAVIIQGRDITERKKAEVELRESEEKYYTLLENLNDGVLYTDTSDKILYANNSFCKMFEYEKEDLIGKIAHELLLDDHARETIESKLQNRREGKSEQYELELKTKSGKTKWVLINGTPIKDSTGSVTGTLGTHMDITERKKAEIELEEKKKEMNTFIYKVSHDLKGPLTSVIGLIDIAKDETTDVVSKNYFDLIDKCTSKLDHTLGDLLELTRIQIGQPQATVINCEQLIKELSEKLQEQEQVEGFEFKHILLSNELFFSDWNLLSSMLRNIMLNSIRYRKRNISNPFVEVSFDITEDKATIIITDNGTGIDESFQHKVFDMFFRGHPNSTGSGLGLFIAKNAVQKLNGTIHIESTKGEGSKVTIELPNLKSETVQSEEDDI